ncbi:MAG: AbrB/MazE/SpoVT family DNA-binding domain-containing protein [Candidatus Nanopelagicales bacterium]|nr:AbrB/MazE/SpoVT family DNA-binding domain-containing protein [Candidatus Nanopelagicales bacterium]
MGPTEAKITSSGQVSLPAALRKRWHADSVLVIDRGDYAIVRPIPADIPSAVKGSMAGPGPSGDEVRATERAAEGSGRGVR